MTSHVQADPGRLRWSGYLLGFGLGGFFDGILLHQILQWHHLLSGLEGGAFRDLRVQVLADGVFHALMYVIAAAGLWLLWRARRDFAARGADRQLFAALLIGFGVWHAVDAVLSHWLLGIHRIRQDAANPLAWDLAWLVAFGLVPLVLGLLLRRRGGGAHGPAAAGLVAAATLAAAVGAALPPPASAEVVAYFPPGAGAPAAFAAAQAVDARVLWADPSGQLFAFALAEPGRGTALYRHGALFVSGGPLSLGCLSWARA